MLTLTMIDKVEHLARLGQSLPSEGTLALCADHRALVAQCAAYRDALLDIHRHTIGHVVNTWHVTDTTRAVIDHALGD